MDVRALLLMMSLAAGLMSCASLRKLSLVETREPASLRPETAASPLRDKISMLPPLSKSCPTEVRELLPSLVLERVSFPPCPARIENAFAAARNVLSMEERSTVEELLNGQCRYGWRELEAPLDSLIDDIVPKSNSGGHNRDTDTEILSPEEMALRLELKSGLQDVKVVYEPLEAWARVNGDFVLPEEQLPFLEQLAAQEKCRMTDQEVDQSYRTLNSLESLPRILSEADPQKKRVERFLTGVHKVIDRKIQEYFKR